MYYYKEYSGIGKDTSPTLLTSLESNQILFTSTLGRAEGGREGSHLHWLKNELLQNP